MFWFVLLLFLAVVTIGVMARPLFAARPNWELPASDQVERLMTVQKEQALRKLKDLELEREAGTIEEDEYQELRQAALTEAALIEKRRRALQEGAQ